MRIKKDQIKTLGVVAVMIAAYLMLIHLPGQRQRTALRTQVQAMQQQVDEQTDTDLPTLRAEAERVRRQLAAEERAICGERDVYLVLDGVSGALAAEGITDHRLAQSDPKRYADYAVQPVQLEFQGPFTDAFAALRAIETQAHPVRIDRIELVGDADEPTGQVMAVVQLSTFYEVGPHE